MANHTHSHQSANKVPVNVFLADVYQAHVRLKEFNRTAGYFRFPYLHYGETESVINELQAGLSDLGYKNGYVTIDNFDWYINSLLNNAKKSGKSIDYDKLEALYVAVIWDGIRFYDELAKKVLGRSPKHVLLLHENDTSALFIGALINKITSQGWKIIAPTEAYADPISEHFPKTLFHKQGRVAAIAYEKDIDISQLRHASENKQYLDGLIANAGVFR